MSLFNFFKRNGSESNGENINHNRFETTNALPEIPENVFIEKENQNKSAEVSSNDKVVKDSNIELLFQFLDKDYEEMGYNDALRNPDSSHLDQNLEAIKNSLFRVIRRVKTFYEDFIKEINFHIESRSRSGMVDTVEELKMKKSIAEDHIKKVIEIEDDAKNNIGESQGIIISYSRGFRNGLAAISHSQIMTKKL